MALRGKELSQDLRDLIIKLHKEKNSQREIAKIVGKSRSTIQKIITKFQITGNTKNKIRTGRPSIFTEKESRMIVRKVKNNPKISAPILKTDIENAVGKTCHPETIRRLLRKAGYHGRSIRKKPYVSKVNRQKRVDFAKQHLKEDNDFWNSIIFSDESKFNILGPDGNKKVWRKANKELDPKNMRGTVKHGGGSVLVWGCMAASGVGKLVMIDGIMNQYSYLKILKDNLQQSAAKLGVGRSFIFQQDNDPKHTARTVQEWLLYNTRKQLKTPPQSPDLNPIEHLWEHLDRQMRKRDINNKNDLIKALLEEWQKIPPTITQKLVYSMPSRLKEVLKAKGYPTKY